MLGFVLAAALLLLIRKSVRDSRLYESPEGRKPPVWVRAVLVLTSSGVSLAHGSNDGQKGVGLIMIIMIASLPAHFALNPEYKSHSGTEAIQTLEQVKSVIQSKKSVMVSQLSSQDTKVDNGTGLFSSKPLDPVSMEIEGVIDLLKKQDALADMSSPGTFSTSKKNCPIGRSYQKNKTFRGVKPF